MLSDPYEGVTRPDPERERLTRSVFRPSPLGRWLRPSQWRPRSSMTSTLSDEEISTAGASPLRAARIRCCASQLGSWKWTLAHLWGSVPE